MHVGNWRKGKKKTKKEREREREREREEEMMVPNSSLITESVQIKTTRKLDIL